jgi:hypothetical protein
MLTRRAKPIRITSVLISEVLLCVVVFELTRNTGILYCTSARVFQKFRSHLQILVARRVACRRFHIEGPQVLGVAVNILVARQSGALDMGTCAVL